MRAKDIEIMDQAVAVAETLLAMTWNSLSEDDRRIKNRHVVAARALVKRLEREGNGNG